LLVPFADSEDFSWGADDEANTVDAPQCSRPGWLWLGYILFGIAFWTGVGFGIHALSAVL
jgi:hypothetical protein